MSESQNIQLPESALNLARTLREAGFEAWAVGGAVRDHCLGHPTHDVDFATDASVEKVAALFERTHAVGSAFGVSIVVIDGVSMEVAQFREEGPYLDGRRPSTVRPGTLESDARRRDFTINALYWDPLAEKLLDPCGGLSDLKAQKIRCIGVAEERFGEDHLRLLRCLRFAAQLDFEIEAEAWAALRPLAHQLDRISVERIWSELSRMLTGPRPARALRMLYYSGLMDRVLPEVSAMVGVPQPPQYHPEGDVFVHTLKVLEELESRSTVLAWAALLHDVGKPPTFRRAERIRFDGHVPVGVSMAKAILRRLRAPVEVRDRVAALVAQHLHFADAPQMRTSTLKRFVGQDYFEDHLKLHRADCLGSHADLSLYEFCRTKLEEFGTLAAQPPPLLGGGDLMALGFPPGPLFKQMLDALRDAQLEGEVNDEAAAKEFILSRWNPIPPNG